MSKALPPLVIRVLTAGAVGTVGAVLLGSLLWLGADAAGVSYEVDGSPNITMRAVITSLAVVGLVATALALLLAKYHNGALYFGGACIRDKSGKADAARLQVLCGGHEIGCNQLRERPVHA